ncbi:MAG: hypothetical protein SCH71_02580 [Desulfobulbaceae bacterium]|nr:hypothetical protein [Desulfobulbaceae bacterium]
MEPNGFDKNMAAATFAQAGDHETANQIMTSEGHGQAGRAGTGNKKPFIPMLAFGALSLTGYIFLINNQQLVMDTFTRGGINTVWPIGTAFLFSFIHGAFASNLLSYMGLEAKKH